MGWGRRGGGEGEGNDFSTAQATNNAKAEKSFSERATTDVTVSPQ